MFYLKKVRGDSFVRGHNCSKEKGSVALSVYPNNERHATGAGELSAVWELLAAEAARRGESLPR